MLNVGAAVLAAPFAFADPTPPDAARSADVIFLGELHDNPGHHQTQAAWTEALQPAALVFEMLTPEQAAKVTEDNRGSQEVLQNVLGWEEAGWPDFAMYHPIFTAAPQAAIYGAAVPREQIRGLMQQDLADVLGEADAARFGLDQPLPADQQGLREEMQGRAHCDALPDEMLPMMVSVQRLRDAALARAALDAHAQTGGPVIVITGNGHARTDWGAPVSLRQADADLTLFALGQGEAGRPPDGTFDAVIDSTAVDRGDPCDALN